MSSVNLGDTILHYKDFSYQELNISLMKFTDLTFTSNSSNLSKGSHHKLQISFMYVTDSAFRVSAVKHPAPSNDNKSIVKLWMLSQALFIYFDP